MTTVSSRTTDFFSRQVVTKMTEKYGFDEKQAIREFFQSETFQMLSDVDLELYKLSPLIIFDMWESEKITGDPRNSQYVRGEINE